MNGNLIIGCLTMAVCLAIQCVILSILLRVLFELKKKQLLQLTLAGVSFVLIAVMLGMLAGNLLQMAIWAGLFYACGEFEEFATAFYHSVVNFTTLGYGDFVMSKGRRLLGALEAANGVIMFGLTTGFLFAVLSTFIHQAWEKRTAQDAPAQLGNRG